MWEGHSCYSLESLLKMISFPPVTFCSPHQSSWLAFITYLLEWYIITHKQILDILVNLTFPTPCKWPWSVHNLSYCCGMNLNHTQFELVLKKKVNDLASAISLDYHPASPLCRALFSFSMFKKSKFSVFVETTKSILVKTEIVISWWYKAVLQKIFDRNEIRKK